MNDNPIPIHRISADQVTPQRWRNNGGWTRELLAWPNADDWVLRISVADVDAAGPFSVFEGVDRWIGVVQGQGMRLRHDPAAPWRTITPADGLYAFQGDDATDCELLAGPIRDLNIMLKRGLASLRITPMAAGQTPPNSKAALLAAIVANPLALIWAPSAGETARSLPIATEPSYGWWLELDPN